MMLTPWGPRAVPTGGAGVAAPAWSCTLTSAAIFFFGGIACQCPSWLYVVVIASRTGPATWLLLGVAGFCWVLLRATGPFWSWSGSDVKSAPWPRAPGPALETRHHLRAA